MNRSMHVKKSVLLLFFVISVIDLFLLVSIPSGISAVYKQNWICDSICIYISMLTLFLLYARGKIDIYSPVIFVSSIYIIMFFVSPIYDIVVGETSVFGVTDLFQYGVKGSLVALAGFISFCLCYAYRYRNYEKDNVIESLIEIPHGLIQNLEHYVLIAWIFIYILGIFIVAVTQGFSVTYILSFGVLGNASAFETTSTTLGFIGQFTRCIVTLYILYFAVSNNKAAKIILFILTALLETINGFRYMIVILICGVFYFSQLKNQKKINALKVIVLIVGMAVLIGVIGFTRNAVRSGGGFSTTGFGIEAIMDAMIGNFRIYKSYYSIIKAVPLMTPYIYFDQILIYTLVMAIPRAIWPGKPLNPGTEAQLYGMNATAVASGFAYPCLGEFYYGFGTIGVVVFMGIIGLWLAKITNRHRNNAKTLLDIVIYSVTVPLMLQLLIRGYTPSNFYLVIALFIPYWVANSYVNKRL